MKSYKEELVKLQIELLKLQTHIKKHSLKLLIIMEGRDAAGKGGTIKRITEHLNPRGARIVALPKPSDVEITQWYFQRYVANLPSGGEIVIFDRSWYNRAVVEPVMGFCTTSQTKEFLEDVPLFENLLSKSDIKIFKIFLSIDKKTQAKRFKDRKNNPLKSYKISTVDEKAQTLWDDYSAAIYNMLIKTSSQENPWMIIDANDKKKARINTIKSILYNFEYDGKEDNKLLKPDNDIVLSVDDAINKISKNNKI